MSVLRDLRGAFGCNRRHANVRLITENSSRSGPIQGLRYENDLEIRFRNPAGHLLLLSTPVDFHLTTLVKESFDFLPLYCNYLYIREINGTRLPVPLNTVFNDSPNVKCKEPVMYALWYLSLPTDNLFGAGVKPQVLPSYCRNLTFADLETAIVKLLTSGHYLSFLRSAMIFYLSFGYSTHKAEWFYALPFRWDWFYSKKFNEKYLYRRYSSPHYGMFMRMSTRHTIPNHEELSNLARGSYEIHHACQLLLEWPCVAGKPRAMIHNQVSKEWRVGATYTPGVDRPRFVKEFISYVDVLCHAIGYFYGDCWWGDLFPQWSLDERHQYTYARHHFYGGVYPRLNLFCPDLREVRIKRGRNTVFHDLGTISMLDESFAGQLIYLQQHGVRKTVPFFAGGVTVHVLLFPAFLLGCELPDEIWNETFEQLSSFSIPFVEPKFTTTYDDLCMISLGLKGSLSPFEATKLLHEYGTSDEAVAQIIVDNGITYLGEDIKPFFPARIFGAQHIIDTRQKFLSKLHHKHEIRSHPVVDETWTYDKLEPMLREYLAWSEKDRKSADYRIDISRLFEDFMRYGDIPFDCPGWQPSKQCVIDTLNFMLDHSSPTTPYQIFVNFFAYSMNHDVCHLISGMWIRLGFFHCNSTERGDLVNLYDQYVMRSNRCPLTNLSFDQCINLAYSFVALLQWGYDETDPKDAIKGELKNLTNFIGLCNNENWFVDENGNKTTQVVKFADMSFNELYDPIAKLKGSDFGEGLGLVELIKGKIKEKYPSVNPDDDDLVFKACARGRFIDALTGASSAIDLFREKLDHIREGIVDTIALRVKDWDITSDRYYRLMWCNLGTPGTATGNPGSNFELKKHVRFTCRVETFATAHHDLSALS